jgi:Domain of unknown function (DUF4136)
MNHSRRLPRASFVVAALAIGATIVSGCVSSAPQPTSMLDAQADFSAYKTFGWDTSVSGDGSGQALSLLDSNIRAAIKSEMTRKGYQEAPAGTTPDLLMSFEAAKAEKIKSNPIRVGVGVGSYGNSGGGGVSVGSPSAKNVKEGTLVVHAIDPKRNAEVWQGRMSRELGKGNADPAVIQSAVADVLHDLPGRTAPP